MPRVLALLLLAMALPAAAGSITLADVCEPSRFKQTTGALEVYCGTDARPWLNVKDCGKPRTARVTRSTNCAGPKYRIVCTDPIAGQLDPRPELVAVEPEPIILACAQP